MGMRIRLKSFGMVFARKPFISMKSVFHLRALKRAIILLLDRVCLFLANIYWYVCLFVSTSDNALYTFLVQTTTIIVSRLLLLLPFLHHSCSERTVERERTRTNLCVLKITWTWKPVRDDGEDVITTQNASLARATQHVISCWVTYAVWSN